jgi:predicted amidophosphoribosyltransferase
MQYEINNRCPICLAEIDTENMNYCPVCGLELAPPEESKGKE